MTFRSEEVAVRTALVKCGQDRSQLWAAVTHIAAWSSPIILEEEQVCTKEKLEERLQQIHQLASEAKEIGV